MCVYFIAECLFCVLPPIRRYVCLFIFSMYLFLTAFFVPGAKYHGVLKTDLGTCVVNLGVVRMLCEICVYEFLLMFFL